MILHFYTDTNDRLIFNLFHLVSLYLFKTFVLIFVVTLTYQCEVVLHRV